MSFEIAIIVLLVMAVLCGLVLMAFFAFKHRRRMETVYPRNNPLLGSVPSNRPSRRPYGKESVSSSSLDSDDDKSPVGLSKISRFSSTEITSLETSVSLSMSNYNFIPSSATLSDLRLSRQRSLSSDPPSPSTSAILCTSTEPPSPASAAIPERPTLKPMVMSNSKSTLF